MHKRESRRTLTGPPAKNNRALKKDYQTDRIANGDEAAFRQFIITNTPPCHAYAYRILKRKELAEDAVSEVFVSVWEARRHLPDIENINAWLHRLTLNKSISLLRKESRWVSGSGKITDLELNIADPGPELEYDRETIYRLNKAIGELPPKCRHVLYLAKIEKMPYREIAHILGISVKTVSNHITYAMKRLTAILKIFLFFI